MSIFISVNIIDKDYTKVNSKKLLIEELYGPEQILGRFKKVINNKNQNY